MNSLLLYNKLNALPAALQLEVADFIEFLAKKYHHEIPDTRPVFGSGSGFFSMKPDFDEPLGDFQDYMQ